VLVYEGLIHKGKSSTSAVHKCMGIDFGIMVSQCIQYN
jgi:hypothetical protein